MRWLTLFLFLIATSSAVSALDCRTLEGDRLVACNDILASDDLQEKDSFILALLAENYQISNFTLVQQWNSNISFSSAPYSVAATNSNYIKDAWMRIILIEPSVQYEGNVLVPSSGKIISAYNYRIKVPTGTASGDCRTDYFLNENSSVLDIYSNDVFIGHNRITSFVINSDSNFSANLKITASIGASHYKSYTYCCSTSRGRCTRTCIGCRFDRTEYIPDYVEIKDDIKTSFYTPQLSYNLEGTGNYLGSYSGRFTFTNYTSVKLSFRNVSYQKGFFTFKLENSFEPYNVLSYSIIKQEYLNSQNIRYSEDSAGVSFVVVNMSSCSIELRTYFEKKIIDCNISFPEPLAIEANKLTYYEGDIIQASISPANASVLVEYANTFKNSTGFLNFTAKYPFNQIRAVSGYQSAEAIIVVERKNGFFLIMGLSIFSAINYVIYAFFKKYWSF